MSRIYSRFKTILASILISCIVLNLFPLSLLALDEPYYSVSEGYEFSVTRVISSRWEGHANIDFTITNNGNATINNWYITTDLPYEVENIWNASIAEVSDRYITISSAPQNQPIEPGCSVTFGITGYSEDDSLFDVESSFYLLNIEDVVIPVEKYQATTNVYSTTETGFSGAIAITNISSELLTIENVVLNSTNGLIINGNAAIEDETTLVVDSNSRNIYPSASIYINFEGTEEIPEVLDLRYTGLAFTLTEDEDNDGILDIDEFLYPEEDPEVTPIPTIAPTNTPEVEPTETPTVSPEEEPTPTPEEVTPTPTPQTNYLLDSDSDCLLDYLEEIVGTDANNPDTDGDGIFDLEELFLGKNPTDNSDGNTLILQTITTEINNAEDSTITSVDITMEDSGYLGYSTYAEDLYNIDVYSTEVAGRIGSPIGLNSTTDFDTATVVIHYDDTKLGDTDEDRLGVLWFDEEHGVYIIQEQAIIDAEQNTVTLELEHFSTYILVDIDEWRNAFSVPEASNGYFVVEYSTSYFVMGGLTNEDKIEAAYTVDEYEPSCFRMWANSAGNYRRNYELVARISGNRTQVDSMRFEHDYVWLVQDVTDRDNDGVYDCYEEDGILGTNGRVYNMRSSMIDSDSDGLSDLEEIGNIYSLYRGEDGRILILNNDGEVLFSGEYYIPETSEYYFLRNYVPGAGKCITICAIESNPNSDDSDSDGIKDNLDSQKMLFGRDRDDDDDRSVRDMLSSILSNFVSDEQGREILLHYLFGNGEKLVLNSQEWSEYMMANEILTSNVSDIVFQIASELEVGEIETVDIVTSMEIDNGESIIGYQYLHGTNSTVGDFQIYGTISRVGESEYIFDLEYVWNDIIDPNFDYDSDTLKNRVAWVISLGNHESYDIQIIWSDVTTISSNGSTGWLA